MIRLDQKFAAVSVGAVATLFAVSAMAAGHREAPATAIDSEQLEALPANQRDLTELLKNVPELKTTARRTEESILDVPIQIRGIGAQELQDAQIQDLSDVANVTPGFSFQNYFGEDLSVPTIRGVAQVDIFGQPNAPVYVDGIYVSSALNFGFLDIERIEVLSGPQPTYFGFNAFSGAVNFVTAKPSDELEVKGEVTLGSDEKRQIAASVSGPMVGDVLSGRISLMYDDFGGTYDNYAIPDQDIGGHKYKIASGTLFFTPSDTFDAQLNLYVSDDKIDPPALNQIPANCEPELDPPTDPMSANPNRLLNYCGDIPSIDKGDLATIPGETGEEREIFRSSLNMNWDLGFGTLSSLTGYSETKGQILASSDRGATGTTYAYRTTTPGFIPGTSVLSTFQAPTLQLSAGKSKTEDFSQELRFSSPKDEPLRYTVGAYVRATETRSPILEGFGTWAGAGALPADAATIFPFGPPDLCPCIEFAPGVGISAGFGGFIFGDIFSAAVPGLDYINESETDLWATFAEVEYDITDDLTFALGGRYTDYEETFKDGDPPTPALAVRKFDDDFFNWRTSLNYRPDDLTKIYFAIATGIKQGGLVTFTPEYTDPMIPNDTVILEFGQEEILTYEVGYSTVQNDGKLRVNAAVFYSDWSDIVLPQVITEVNGNAITPEGVSGNIGDGKIAGFELSLNNAFNDALDGGIGLSYNRARFNKGQVESFMAFPSFAPNGSMAGQKFSRQPEFQANANLTFRTQFNSDWEWYTRGDVNYQSRWYVGLPNQARIPGRFRANARIGLDSEVYTIEFWINNVFDDDTVDSAFRDVYLANALPDGTNNFDTLFPWRLTAAHPERRTFGVTMRGRF